MILPATILASRGCVVSTNCLLLSRASVLRQSRPWVAKDTTALRSRSSPPTNNPNMICDPTVHCCVSFPQSKEVQWLQIILPPYPLPPAPCPLLPASCPLPPAPCLLPPAPILNSFHWQTDNESRPLSNSWTFSRDCATV